MVYGVTASGRSLTADALCTADELRQMGPGPWVTAELRPMHSPGHHPLAVATGYGRAGYSQRAPARPTGHGRPGYDRPDYGRRAAADRATADRAMADGLRPTGLQGQLQGGGG